MLLFIELEHVKGLKLITSSSRLLSYPMPTAICLSAVSALPELPDAIIIAESGTAPKRGRTIPPELKD